MLQLLDFEIIKVIYGKSSEHQ